MEFKNQHMKKYIGQKTILAEPMTRGEYNKLRGWETPKNEELTDEGYLVEYLDSPNKNHEDYDNYISWSPADVFDRSYRQINNMTFGMALEALRAGEKVCRDGWNGKGMFVYLQKGSELSKTELLPGPVENHVAPVIDGEIISIAPHIGMKTADGSISVGWRPTNIDMFTEDWQILSA